MESWSVWGSNFTPDSVVYIDGLPYYPEVLSDHNLVIPAVAETAQAKLDGGERVSVLVLRRTAEDDELRTVSSSVYFAGAEVE